MRDERNPDEYARRGGDSAANVVDATAAFECARVGHEPSVRINTIWVESWICRCLRCKRMVEFKNREVIRVS